MKSIFRWGFFVFFFTFLSSIILPGAPFSFAQSAPIKAIMNVPWGPETAVGLQHKDFVDLVAEKTKGRVVIEAYYASSLYGLDQQTPMLQKNAIQFGAQSGWYWQKLDPACSLTWCPFSSRLRRQWPNGTGAQRCRISLKIIWVKNTD